MNFKKITAIGTSVLIAGMTMGLAAAATYPAPFVQNGAGNFAVVYGTGAGVSATDLISATALADALSDKVTSTVGLGDEKVQIDAAGNKLTFEEAINTVREKITSTHLPTLFAARKIRDTPTGSIDYTQWMELSADSVTFDTLGGDEDNYRINTDLASDVRPVLHIDQSSGAAWDLVVDFDKAVDFTRVRNGEKLVIAGKEYSVAKDLTGTGDLVLYASSKTVTIPAGSSEAIVVDGKSYTISVEGANTDAATPTAVIYVDGEADTVEEGDTVYSGDQEFYINRIFMQTIPTQAASVEIFAGAEKLTLPYAGGTVEIDGEDVDGVEVAITKTTNLTDVTKLTFTFTPSNLDLDTDEANYLEIGETIADPVFGTFALSFDSASMDLKDSAKGVVEFKRVAEKLQLKFTNRNGDEYTFIPIVDNKATAMEWHDNFYGTNTAALVKNDLVILQEGASAKNAITRIAKVTSAVNGDEITFDDISTGAKTTVEDGDRIWSTTGASFTAGAYACNNVTLSYDYAPYAPATANATRTNTTYVMEGWFLGTTTGCSYQAPASGDNVTNAQAIAAGITAAGTNYMYPMLPLYTQENARITLTDANDAVIREQYDISGVEFPMNFTFDSGLDGEFVIELYSSDADWSYAADDEGENGYYLSDFGTYAESDLEDDALVTFYIPSEEVTYNVYVGATAEAEAEEGAILVRDSEVASVATKNLIVVGGSCINSAAATLIGGAKCGDAWTAATEAGTGKFVIKSYADNALTSELAVLVAGYEVADTANAVSYFQNKVTDTSKNYLGTSAISATVVA